MRTMSRLGVQVQPELASSSCERLRSCVCKCGSRRARLCVSELRCAIGRQAPYAGTTPFARPRMYGPHFNLSFQVALPAPPQSQRDSILSREQARDDSKSNSPFAANEYGVKPLNLLSF